MSLPQFQTMPLGRLREPFDHPNWIFELKYDRFRALAYVEDGRADLAIVEPLVEEFAGRYRAFSRDRITADRHEAEDVEDIYSENPGLYPK